MGAFEGMRRAVDRLKKRGFQTYSARVADAGETRLFVRRDKLEVKVEVNFVLRGTVYPVRRASLSLPRRRGRRWPDLALPVLSLDELYWRKSRCRLGSTRPAGLIRLSALHRKTTVPRRE